MHLWNQPDWFRLTCLKNHIMYLTFSTLMVSRGSRVMTWKILWCFISLWPEVATHGFWLKRLKDQLDVTEDSYLPQWSIADEIFLFKRIRQTRGRRSNFLLTFNQNSNPCHPEIVPQPLTEERMITMRAEDWNLSLNCTGENWLKFKYYRFLVDCLSESNYMWSALIKFLFEGYRWIAKGLLQ